MNVFMYVDSQIISWKVGFNPSNIVKMEKLDFTHFRDMCQHVLIRILPISKIFNANAWINRSCLWKYRDRLQNGFYTLFWYSLAHFRDMCQYVLIRILPISKIFNATALINHRVVYGNVEIGCNLHNCWRVPITLNSVLPSFIGS